MSDCPLANGHCSWVTPPCLGPSMVIRLRDGSGWAVLTFALAVAAGLATVGALGSRRVGRARRKPLAVSTTYIGGAGMRHRLQPSVDRPVAARAPTTRVRQAQFAAFALQGEAGLGTLVNAFSLGEIWKTSILPSERTEPVLVLIATAMTLVAAAGLRMVPTPLARRVSPVTVVAGGLLVFAFLTSRSIPSPGGLGLPLAAHARPRPCARLPPPARAVGGGRGCWVRWCGGVGVAPRRSGPGGLALGSCGRMCALPRCCCRRSRGGSPGNSEPSTTPMSGTTSRLCRRQPPSCCPGTGPTEATTGTATRRCWTPRHGCSRERCSSTIVTSTAKSSSPRSGCSPHSQALDAQPDQAAERLRALGVERVVVERGNGVEQARVPTGTTVYQGRWLQVVDLGDSAGFRRPAPSRISVLAADALALLTFPTAMGLMPCRAVDSAMVLAVCAQKTGSKNSLIAAVVGAVLGHGRRQRRGERLPGGARAHPPGPTLTYADQ